MKSPPLHHGRPSLVTCLLALLGALVLPVMAAEGIRGETEHFEYYMPPLDGPYIDTQRGSTAFAFKGTSIMLSEDCGKTWPHVAEFADAEKITFSVILKNGNVLFATQAKLFLSSDQLKSHREIIVKRPDGSDYRPHTPVKPDQPGWYFHALDGEHCFEVNGKEMLVWGNYCNVLGGPVPVNIYYSTDAGETVKLAYACGIIWSPNHGKTWAQHDLKEFGARSGCRINAKNSEGWFRMDLRKGWIERAEVLFLKPKR